MKRENPITELQYYLNGRLELKDVECTICHQKGGLFTGGLYIGCHFCLGFPDDLNNLIEKKPKGNEEKI